jgi:hypothetical protein
MTKSKQTWWEKWLAREEGYSNGDNSGKGVSKVTSTRGEDKLESGDGNPESGNYHPKSGNHNLDSGNSNPGKERSQSRWTSTWSSQSQQISVHL